MATKSNSKSKKRVKSHHCDFGHTYDYDIDYDYNCNDDKSLSPVIVNLLTNDGIMDSQNVHD